MAGQHQRTLFKAGHDRVRFHRIAFSDGIIGERRTSKSFETISGGNYREEYQPQRHDIVPVATKRSTIF